MAWQKIQHGTAENGFAKSYMDEGFNELIYQWDSCFMTAFAVYAREVFPVMASLDNFYDKQREDGYIQRVYWEKDGSLVNAPTSDEPMVNPPLFAWMEWRYYQITGDSSRIRRVLPVLTSYDEWLTHNCRSDKTGTYTIFPCSAAVWTIPRARMWEKRAGSIFPLNRLWLLVASPKWPLQPIKLLWRLYTGKNKKIFIKQ
jgi:hypothetical protein